VTTSCTDMVMAAASDASPVALPQENLDEVWSWLHDEFRTVTAKSISLAQFTSRQTAREILCRLISVCPSQTPEQFHLTYTKQCQVTDDDGTKRMTMSLADTTVKAGESVDDEMRMNLYAVSLVRDHDEVGAAEVKQCRSQLVEAVLKDVFTLREPSVLHNLDEFAEKVQCADIRPADGGAVPIREDSKLARARRMEACGGDSGSNGHHDGNHNGAKKQIAIVRGPSKKEDKRKVTTAASFFGAASKGKKAKASAGASKGADAVDVVLGEKNAKMPTATQATSSRTQATTKNISSDKKAVNKSEAMKKKRVFLEDSDDDDVDEADEPLSKIRVEPSSSSSSGPKDNKPSYVGNADDFEGDVDEDEDDEREEQARKLKKDAQRIKKADEVRSKRSKAARAAAETRKKRKAEEQVGREDDDDEGGGSAKVVGAIDAFASTKSKSNGTMRHTTSTNGNKVQRQRKKLVEKTTMDKNGYIHTEMVEVVEDIPSDEDENQKPTRSQLSTTSTKQKTKPKAKAKNTKNMKQAGLMGFFAKKK